MTAALAACGIALTIAALTAGALRIHGRDMAATWRDLLDRAAARLDRWFPPAGRHHSLTPAPRAAVRAGQAPSPAAHVPWQPDAGTVGAPDDGPAPAAALPPAPEDATAPLPQPGNSGAPGLGQHPFNAPVYGHRDGQRVRRPIAVIRNGHVSDRETGQLEALAAPVVREWVTDRDTLTRALDALNAMEVS